jgi:hypothetical protein
MTEVPTWLWLATCFFAGAGIQSIVNFLIDEIRGADWTHIGGMWND